MDELLLRDPILTAVRSQLGRYDKRIRAGSMNSPRRRRASFPRDMHPNSAKILQRVKGNLKAYDLTGAIQSVYPRSSYEDYALGTAEQAKESTVKLIEYALGEYRRDAEKSGGVGTSRSRQVTRVGSGRRNKDFGNDMRTYEKMDFAYIERALAGLCPIWPFC